MRIGIDLDGVVFDFAASLRRWLRHSDYERYRNLPDTEPTRWDFWPEWGMTKDEFIQACHDGVNAGFVFRGPMRPGTKQAFDYLAGNGHTLHLITDRSFGEGAGLMSRYATRQWLGGHDLPYNSLTFSADKTCVPTDAFIEDKPENFERLWAAGVECYMVTRPWNESHPVLPKFRVASILEFSHRVHISRRLYV